MTATLLLYTRALLPKRAGGHLPDARSRTPPRPADPDRLRRYRAVCGLAEGDGGHHAALPPLYPHLAAFRASLTLMARRDFPYPLPGLVHVANEVERLRRVGASEPLAHEVWLGEAVAHPRGVAFPVHAEASVAGETVWRSVSTYLRRGSAPDTDARRGGDPVGAPVAGRGGEPAGTPGAGQVDDPVGEPAEGSVGTPAGEPTLRRVPDPPALSRDWHVPVGTGRAYGAVTGDRNPIHLHPLTARPFGFRRAIAHGMWTQARALALLAEADAVPDAVRIAVRFRAPVPLPSELRLLAGPTGPSWAFEVRSREQDRTHVRGEVTPLAALG